ncbi:MAG TPA: hypothetical protein RMH99_20965 [Sandaracinaceae bacterium LLY-WYZ-13_1]|nr:hypothetical protein [Sandaracinaceae bacterium LLY-WYZ-13_1]
MGFGFGTLPQGTDLGPLSRRVFDTLAEHTSFPWPILQAQCNRVGADPENLRPQDLEGLVDHLAEAVGRFTSPRHREEVRVRLQALH